MFHCDDGDHLVPRGDAEYINGEWRCPRCYQPESQQTQLVTDGGGYATAPELARSTPGGAVSSPLVEYDQDPADSEDSDDDQEETGEDRVETDGGEEEEVRAACEHNDDVPCFECVFGGEE